MRQVNTYFVLLLFFLCSSYSISSWAKSSTDKDLQPLAVAGEVVVKITSDQKANTLSFLKNAGLENLRTLDLLAGTFVVGREKSSLHLKNQKSFLRNLESLPGVIYAEPNFLYHTLGKAEGKATNDPNYEVLWGIENLGKNEPASNGSRSNVAGVSGADSDVSKAWSITKGSYQVKIAVIDTGIDYNHPDLQGNIWTNTAEANGKAGVDDDNNGFVDDIHGYNFADNNSNPMDGHSHGTHCSGTIAAKHNNGIGVTGMMDEVSLVAVKFLADNGQGTLEAAMKAIDYATKMNVDIMSNSWGGGGFSQALEDVIKAASNRGIVFVAAAGNDTIDNDSSPHYPSTYKLPNVIAVAAHTAQDSLASFSNWGKNTVHLAAPGKNILSTVPGNKYAVYSGTSMATPHVSGAIGLLFALEGRMNLDEVRSRIMETSNPISSYRGKVVKGGRLSAYNLLTDTRPPRHEPVAGAWKNFTLNPAFESAHPYLADSNVEKSFQIPGAQFIRAVVAKYEIEDKWDFLYILDGSRSLLDKLSGTGTNFTTEFVEGDSITLNFKSDQVVNKWGFLVQELQYQ